MRDSIFPLKCRIGHMEFFQEVFGFWFFLSKKNIRVKKSKKPASNLANLPLLCWLGNFILFSGRKKRRGEKPQTKTRKISPKQYSVLVPVYLLRILSLPFARPGKTSVYEKQNPSHGTVGPPCPFFL